MYTRTLPDIIRTYIVKDKLRLDRQLRFYAEKPSIEAAIQDAALALDEQGRRHPHHRRLTRETLHAAQCALLAAAPALNEVESFDALYKWVEAATSKVEGLGELYTYDTALRIGARLGLEPEAVYVHTRVRKVARRLGVETRARMVPLPVFPAELAHLSPKDVERLLGIYKDRLPVHSNK